jgi:NAD(P)-dependent dehydrogenase (short-subunit alcohol dehydrogenase family)
MAPRHSGLPTAVRDPGAVEALARAAVDAFGRVDVVCNNAGVWTLGHPWGTPLEDRRRVVDVNLWGCGVRRAHLRPAAAGQPRRRPPDQRGLHGRAGGHADGSPTRRRSMPWSGCSKNLRAELAGRTPRVGISVVCLGACQDVNPGDGQPTAGSRRRSCALASGEIGAGGDGASRNIGPRRLRGRTADSRCGRPRRVRGCCSPQQRPTFLCCSRTSTISLLSSCSDVGPPSGLATRFQLGARRKPEKRSTVSSRPT